MNNVYFGANGITSTEGNYLCNIAKELQQAATERLNNVKFFDTSVAVIGSSNKQVMSTGNTNLDFIANDLQQLAEMNAFCAWVREAIKEKENQQRIYANYCIENWAVLRGITFPEAPQHPEEPEYITEQSVMESWNASKRNRYLQLEAFAATYGKYIHPDGAYNKARKNAYTALNTPITKEGAGRDMILYYREPSVNINDVDALFITMQSQYREYEKQLNQMKAEIKETVNDLTVKAQNRFKEDLAVYKAKYEEYDTIMSRLRSDFFTWKTNQLEAISKYKIFIPDSLESVFKTLKEMAK